MDTEEKQSISDEIVLHLQPFFSLLFFTCLFYKLHLLMEASKTRRQPHSLNQNTQFASFAPFRSLFFTEVSISGCQALSAAERLTEHCSQM